MKVDNYHKYIETMRIDANIIDWKINFQRVHFIHKMILFFFQLFLQNVIICRVRFKSVYSFSDRTYLILYMILNRFRNYIQKERFLKAQSFMDYIHQVFYYINIISLLPFQNLVQCYWTRAFNLKSDKFISDRFCF